MARFVLLHVRGPAVPDRLAVGDRRASPSTTRFLQRRHAAGELVAAGPFEDTEGSGMTILDVESLEEAVRLATQDDRSVVDGVLAVTVRPWRVVLSRD